MSVRPSGYWSSAAKKDAHLSQMLNALFRLPFPDDVAFEFVHPRLKIQRPSLQFHRIVQITGVRREEHLLRNVGTRAAERQGRSLVNNEQIKSTYLHWKQTR